MPRRRHTALEQVEDEDRPVESAVFHDIDLRAEAELGQRTAHRYVPGGGARLDADRTDTSEPSDEQGERLRTKALASVARLIQAHPDLVRVGGQNAFLGHIGLDRTDEPSIGLDPEFERSFDEPPRVRDASTQALSGWWAVRKDIRLHLRHCLGDRVFLVGSDGSKDHIRTLDPEALVLIITAHAHTLRAHLGWL